MLSWKANPARQHGNQATTRPAVALDPNPTGMTPPLPPPPCTEEANVNMFFGSRRELNDVSKKDDATTAYIILQNDRLHAQAERTMKRVKDLERDLAAARADADRAERSKTCILGVVHNEVEKSRIMSDILREMDGSARSVSQLLATAAAHAAAAAVFHAAGCCLSPTISTAGQSLLAAHACSAAYLAWTYRKRGASETSRVVRELKGELDRAQRGTDRIHDILDEM